MDTSNIQALVDATNEISTNEAFTDFAQYAKEEGVTNWRLPLALLNKKLTGVCPHSVHLTDEQKIMISIECRYNPIYFFREVLKPITSKWERQEVLAAIAWTMSNDVMFYHMDTQTLTEMVAVYVYVIGEVNTFGVVLHKSFDARSKSSRIIKDTVEAFIPRWMKGDQLHCNSEVARNLTIKSQLWFGYGNKDVHCAANVGRGMSASMLTIKDINLVPNIHITWPSLIGTMGHSVDVAKRNETRRGILMSINLGVLDERVGADFTKQLIETCTNVGVEYLDLLFQDHRLEIEVS